MKFVYDTNCLIQYPHLLELEGEKIVPLAVLRELDKLKIGNNDIAYRARQAIRKLKKLNNIIFDFEFDNDGYIHTDDLIIECAQKHNATVVSGDYVVQLKAKSRNLDVFDDFDIQSEDDYKGYIELKLTDEEIADFYQSLNENKYNLLVNQYVILRNQENEVIDTLRWNGESFVFAHHKGVNTTMFGKFKPLDAYQVCALDSLSNNQMTMLKGKAGSGKSLIAINYAWSQIEKGKYDKLVIFTNPVNTRNSARIGFYPGTRTEKLLETNVGLMLSSKFGDLMTVEMFISQGKIELLPFADIRGWDSTGKRAIVYFSEAQNLDIELMRLGISRCGDDSLVIIDGDYYSQVDSDQYAGLNNGMRRVSEVFRGQEFYGEVYLPNVYRSKMADRAQLL